MSDSLRQEIDRFVAAARSFVDWCETSHARDNREAFRLESIRRLSRLYTAALDLPEVPFREAPDIPSASEEKRQALEANLAPLPFQIYWEALEPANLEKDGNVACGDLFDDFLDIHADIGGGLWLYDQGHPEAAVCHWRVLYFHWSEHIIGALHALHLYKPSEMTADKANG